jgi:CheY-like chemotaxis protein
VLTNLLSNAHKYTPVEGSIEVAVRAEADQVRVDVRDTGIGLSAEEQEQLFTKFYRARHPEVQEVVGTGLGLAITRSLIELHGGTIGVRSAPGEGSTFTFTLPLAEQQAAGTPELPDRPRARILVVEDEPDAIEHLREPLTRAGYQVLVAHTAARALQLALEERPDLVTLDLMLPDAGGLTVLERLRRFGPTASLPVLLVSNLPDDGYARLYDAVDYLGKPFQERALLDRVRRLLAHEQRPLRRGDADRPSESVHAAANVSSKPEAGIAARLRALSDGGPLIRH